MSVCVHECVYVSAGDLQRPQASDPLELELQIVMGYLTWVLGTSASALSSVGGTL